MNERTPHANSTFDQEVKDDEAHQTTLHKLETIVEGVTGQTAADLRNQTLTQLRRKVEEKVRKKLVFRSHFPLIGRGNVMRDKTVDHEAIEEGLHEALK
jgi:hypothetical protein